jgi:type VI secretion system protein ImpA
MASPPLLDFAALVQPIPGDDPAGASLPFPIRQKLEEGRKEDNPDDYSPDDPMRPETFKKAEWKEVTRVAQEALTGTSKDLLLAARLTESLTRQHGFAGLRDGLHLLRELVGQCWDRLYPPLEDGDVEVRASAFNWLDDSARGARFPNTVRQVPLIFSPTGGYSWQDWRRMQEGKGGPSTADFEKAVVAMPVERCQAILEDATQALEEANHLVNELNPKMGPLAPGLTMVRQAIQECLGLERQIVQRKGGGGAAAEAEAGPGEGAAPAARGGGPAPGSRADAYHQLAQAAAVLQQLEPHSPIPYLVQRAVQLGGLPFPQLIRELVRDANILRELNRELGIKEEGEAAPPA